MSYATTWDWDEDPEPILKKIMPDFDEYFEEPSPESRAEKAEFLRDAMREDEAYHNHLWDEQHPI